MEKKLANVPGSDRFIGGAPRSIDCGVWVWCIGHFLYGWLFDSGLCGLCSSSNGCGWIWTKDPNSGVFTAEVSALLSLLYDTLLRLYSLRRDVLFSLVA
jgi:hypothetical protein